MDRWTRSQSFQTNALCRSTESWSALAGYFDGDGTVEFSIHLYTLQVRLAFDENWRPHLEGVRQFLHARGVVFGLVRKKDGYNTWHVVVSNIDGVTIMAERMLPYVTKKKRELQAILDYNADRITGDQFVCTMNARVAVGERTGKYRGRGPEFLHSRGVLQSRKLGDEKRALGRILHLPADTVKNIKKARQEESLSLLQLSRRYGRSIPVIKRALSLP